MCRRHGTPCVYVQVCVHVCIRHASVGLCICNMHGLYPHMHMSEYARVHVCKDTSVIQVWFPGCVKTCAWIHVLMPVNIQGEKVSCLYQLFNNARWGSTAVRPVFKNADCQVEQAAPTFRATLCPLFTCFLWILINYWVLIRHKTKCFAILSISPNYNNLSMHYCPTYRWEVQSSGSNNLK